MVWNCLRDSLQRHSVIVDAVISIGIDLKKQNTGVFSSSSGMHIFFQGYGLFYKFILHIPNFRTMTSVCCGFGRIEAAMMQSACILLVEHEAWLSLIPQMLSGEWHLSFDQSLSSLSAEKGQYS